MSSNTPTMTFVVGIIEKRFSYKNKKNETAYGQKIFIRSDSHKYIMAWDHEDYSGQFKEGQTIITQNLVSKDHNDGYKYYTAGKNAHLELYEDPMEINEDGVPEQEVKTQKNFTPDSLVEQLAILNDTLKTLLDLLRQKL